MTTPSGTLGIDTPAGNRRFRRRLLSWYDRVQRDLPWRRTKDPYRIWLSEIMLQQTRVAAVIPYYERFLERFADVHALAGAPQEDVLRQRMENTGCHGFSEYEKRISSITAERAETSALRIS